MRLLRRCWIDFIKYSHTKYSSIYGSIHERPHTMGTTFHRNTLFDRTHTKQYEYKLIAQTMHTFNPRGARLGRLYLEIWGSVCP